MIVTVCVSEEVAANRRQPGSCCVQTSMKSLKVIGQSPKTSLNKRKNSRKKHRKHPVKAFPSVLEQLETGFCSRFSLWCGVLGVGRSSRRASGSWWTARPTRSTPCTESRHQEAPEEPKNERAETSGGTDPAGGALWGGGQTTAGLITRPPASYLAPPSLTSPGHSAPWLAAALSSTDSWAASPADAGSQTGSRPTGWDRTCAARHSCRRASCDTWCRCGRRSLRYGR